MSLDVGGTKLAAGLVDASTGQVLQQMRCATPTDAAGSYRAMLALAQNVQRQTNIAPEAVGVSFGGPVAADGRTVRLSMHVPGWHDAPLADWLERDIGLPCTVANDADAAALAEQRYGAGKGVADLLYLTVSTGIGGGIVINGALYRGARAWAGEVGHQVLDPDGPACACGRNGCLESLASGQALARAARNAASNYPAQTRLSHASTAHDVALAVAAGDPLAQELWQTATTWLGIGIANAANLLNPERVVLGGGLTRAGALLFDPVRRVVARRICDPALVVLPAALGDAVGLCGAAAIGAGV